MFSMVSQPLAFLSNWLGCQKWLIVFWGSGFNEVYDLILTLEQQISCPRWGWGVPNESRVNTWAME